MKADKPFEEVQVSDTAIWRWVREGDLYVSRMTQEHMDQFKRDVEQGRLDEREACAKLCESLASSIAPRAEYYAELIRARDEPSPAFKNYMGDNWAGIV
jgi:hypothetical protein